MEELVVELGAAFLCADLELTPETREDHASSRTRVNDEAAAAAVHEFPLPAPLVIETDRSRNRVLI
jgi:antirestriction protein ArdC